MANDFNRIKEKNYRKGNKTTIAVGISNALIILDQQHRTFAKDFEKISDGFAELVKSDPGVKGKGDIRFSNGLDLINEGTANLEALKQYMALVKICSDSLAEAEKSALIQSQRQYRSARLSDSLVSLAGFNTEKFPLKDYEAVFSSFDKYRFIDIFSESVKRVGERDTNFAEALQSYVTSLKLFLNIINEEMKLLRAIIDSCSNPNNKAFQQLKNSINSGSDIDKRSLNTLNGHNQQPFDRNVLNVDQGSLFDDRSSKASGSRGLATQNNRFEKLESKDKYRRRGQYEDEYRIEGRYLGEDEYNRGGTNAMNSPDRFQNQGDQLVRNKTSYEKGFPHNTGNAKIDELANRRSY